MEMEKGKYLSPVLSMYVYVHLKAGRKNIFTLKIAIRTYAAELGIKEQKLHINITYNEAKHLLEH